MADNIYQIKVTLKNIRPPIWRRLLVPQDIRLDGLHETIQYAMGWDDYHLHSFRQGRTFYGPPDPDGFFDGDDLNEAEFQLDQLLVEPKQKIIYEYDFGDGWEHEILLEKILPPEEDMEGPVCLTGRRACPPEDCGGPWGYAELLDALADADHPRHEEFLEWIGEDFDPENFDIDATNAILHDLSSEDHADHHHSHAMPQFGLLPPEHDFILNPYIDARFSSCPGCEARTRLRKFILLVRLEEQGIIPLNQAARYCPDCDLIIAHQDELEAQLSETVPDITEDDYLVLGTLDRRTWRKGMREELTVEEIRANAADFARHLQLT